jgi:hypothetical protein
MLCAQLPSPFQCLHPGCSALGLLHSAPHSPPPPLQANSRNLKLLQEHLEHPREAKRADCCFLSGVFLLFVVLPILLVGALIAGIVILILWLTGVLFH